MLVLSDTPNPKEDVPTCLSGNLRDVTDCVKARDKADRPELLAAERSAAQENDAAFAVTSDWLCGPDTCPVILGDLLMYRDDNHITATMATELTDFIDAAATPCSTDARTWSGDCGAMADDFEDDLPADGPDMARCRWPRYTRPRSHRAVRRGGRPARRCGGHRCRPVRRSGDRHHLADGRRRQRVHRPHTVAGLRVLAIDWFDTNDKAVLRSRDVHRDGAHRRLLGVLVSMRQRWIGVVGFLGFGVVGALAVLNRPGVPGKAALAPLIGGAFGALCVTNIVSTLVGRWRDARGRHTAHVCRSAWIVAGSWRRVARWPVLRWWPVARHWR